MLVKVEELTLGCPFADNEHKVIADALNATAKALSKGHRTLVFETLLPSALDYLDKHLTHEERVLHNAILYWAEEKNLGDQLEEFYFQFQKHLRGRGKDLTSYGFGDFLLFLEEFSMDLRLKELVKLLEHQRKGHRSVRETLKRELSKIDPSEEPKRLVEQLGVAVSFVLNRVLKLDRKYVEFYKEYGIPACGEKPLLPPAEVVRLIEKILKEEEEFVL